MNILVISGSPRKGGNTEIMVQAFAQGAGERPPGGGEGDERPEGGALPGL